MKSKIRSFCPAVLLGGDSVNALAVARNLGRYNINNYYVTEKRNEVFFSRYCNRSFIVPNIERDPEILKQFLFDIKSQIEDVAVIFPNSDLFCITLSKIKSEIEDKYIFLTPRICIETLVNKRVFYQSLIKNKISHPTTYFPDNYNEVKEIKQKIEYPVIIKPAITQLFAPRFGSKVIVVRSQEELESYCKLALRYNIVIQEIVPGPSTNIFAITGYFDRNHNPNGLFAYQRKRDWPIGFGCNSLIESIPIDALQTCIETTTRYLREIGYTGLFEAEFKKDSRDGCFKLIEINARTWWQNKLPTVCGLNLVMMAYLDAIGERVKQAETYITGLKWVFFPNDLLSFITRFQKGEIGFPEWLLSYRNVRDYAYFSPDDPFPSIMYPMMSGLSMLQSLFRRIGKRGSLKSTQKSNS